MTIMLIISRLLKLSHIFDMTLNEFRVQWEGNIMNKVVISTKAISIQKTTEREDTAVRIGTVSLSV